MPTAHTIKGSQSARPLKRPRPPTSPNPASEARRKKQKSTESSEEKPVRISVPVPAPAEGMNFRFMQQNSKPSPRKLQSTITQANVKPEPQPIRSDIFRSRSSRPAKDIPFLDLTEDTSDEPTGEGDTISALQKKVTELTSERNDYRRSLHDAQAEIRKYKEEALMRTARDHIDSEKREAKAMATEQELQNAKERSNQLAKVKKDLDQQLKVSKTETDRLKESLDGHWAKQLEAKESDVARVQKSLQMQVIKCKQLTKDNNDLKEQVKAKEASTAVLQKTHAKHLEEHAADLRRSRETFHKYKQRYTADIDRRNDLERKDRERLQAEVAKTKELEKQIKAQESIGTQTRAEVAKAKSDLEKKAKECESIISNQPVEMAKIKDLEKQVNELESTLTRLRMESEKAKDDLDEQKETSDWFEAKFLKFRGWFYAQEKERKEKDLVLRQCLAAFKTLPYVFDPSKPAGEFDAAMKALRADNA